MAESEKFSGRDDFFAAGVFGVGSVGVVRDAHHAGVRGELAKIDERCYGPLPLRGWAVQPRLISA